MAGELAHHWLLSPKGYMNLLFPKPTKKKKRRPQYEQKRFSEKIRNAAPYGRCQNKTCKQFGSGAHHIIFKSQEGCTHTLENGIWLCEPCHDNTHGKGMSDLPARLFMIKLLDELKPVDYGCPEYHCRPAWRWTEAYEYLKRKEGMDATEGITT